VWAWGVDLDFGMIDPSAGARRVPLPTYPFDRQEYWIAPPLPRRDETGDSAATEAAAHAASALRWNGDGQEGHQSRAGALTAISAHHMRPPLAVAYAPPVDEVERELADIWEELIGVGGLGVDDDFFELGGDSLVAVRLVARIRERLGIELDVRALFDCQTIARLAARVREELGTTAQDRSMSQFLEMVEQMSDDEVEVILAKWTDQPSRGPTPGGDEWGPVVASHRSAADNAGASGHAAASARGTE
jgi:acyl carrier protein